MIYRLTSWHPYNAKCNWLQLICAITVKRVKSSVLLGTAKVSVKTLQVILIGTLSHWRLKQFKWNTICHWVLLRNKLNLKFKTFYLFYSNQHVYNSCFCLLHRKNNSRRPRHSNNTFYHYFPVFHFTYCIVVYFHSFVRNKLSCNGDCK